MTVRELIEKLEAIGKDDRIVVMSKDGEGNGFSPLDHVESQNCAYKADSTWSGTVGLEYLTHEMVAQRYGDGDVIEDGQRAVCLWPVN